MKEKKRNAKAIQKQEKVSQMVHTSATHNGKRVAS